MGVFAYWARYLRVGVCGVLARSALPVVFKSLARFSIVGGYMEMAR